MSDSVRRVIGSIAPTGFNESMWPFANRLLALSSTLRLERFGWKGSAISERTYKDGNFVIKGIDPVSIIDQALGRKQS